MNGIDVRLPNGTTRKANYRADFTDAAYVRVRAKGKDVTVSGTITYVPGQFLGRGYYTFAPKGQNAHLVQ